MSNTPLAVITSSAEDGETDDDLLDYAKLIETFRAIDKNNRGYLSKKQYKRFLHEMKIYHSEEFANISFRALAVTNPNSTEHQEPPQNGFRSFFSKNKQAQMNCDSDDECQSTISCSARTGITFDNARIVCEAFFSPAFNSTSETLHHREKSNAPIPMSNLKEKVALDQQQPPLTRSVSDPIPSKNLHQLASAKKAVKKKRSKNQTRNKLCSLILFRGVDHDKDGRITSEQFHTIARIIDEQLAQEEIDEIFHSCVPNVYDHTVSYSSVAKNLFDVFVWGEENPFSQDFANYLPSSQVCLLL